MFDLIASRIPLPMIQKVRWMQDILPEMYAYYTHIIEKFEILCKKYGCERISTPILEYKDLFTGAIGQGTDIVEKEMYIFYDRKQRELALKPESTAGIMRAYLENDFQSGIQPVYFYYIEPHFRYDRPQKWRYRQFFQAGVEVIWESDPFFDAELIYMGYTFLETLLGKETFTLKINTLGTEKEREAYIHALKEYYANKKHLLSHDALVKLEYNPLRILDTKIEEEKILATYSPKIEEFLTKESQHHYETVKRYLDGMGVRREQDHTLVRGLDYYSHTVWEFIDTSSTSQNALWGGGRYNGLSQKIGYKENIPWVGFALWIERIIQHMKEQEIPTKREIDMYFIALWEEAKHSIFPLFLQCKEHTPYSVFFSPGSASLKNQLRKAHKMNAKYVIIIGTFEAKNNTCKVRNMQEGTQKEILQTDLISYIEEQK